ncbi:unnamed protein product [Phytomonas sp. Hart1]|nr:unnamed protein product [Phytomonas sp. Hart1]|eukprot:CCW66338.1 unnamed protein product [Phytomonas sp. isolate Hart1]
MNNAEFTKCCFEIYFNYSCRREDHMTASGQKTIGYRKVIDNLCKWKDLSFFMLNNSKECSLQPYGKNMWE